MLQQLGKVSQLSCLNLARLALQILVLHGDIPIALHLHENGQKAEARIPHNNALGAALKWEGSRDGDVFPHLYGSLPLTAVLWVEPLPLGIDRRHVFPELIP